MIKFKHKGDFSKTTNKLKNLVKGYYRHEKIFNTYGEAGVTALAAATPKDTGKTAASWRYELTMTEKGMSLVWINDNMSGNTKSGNPPVVILIEYGHMTRNGGYVPPRPFLKQTMEPIFRDLVVKIGKGVNE